MATALNAARTAARAFISSEAAAQLRDARLLVDESHRVRPRYFDGKFLAARDLTRDQAYFLARQASFARALGAGVVEGLQVSAGDVASDLRVSAGLGFTPGGELVSLQNAVTVSLAQLFRLQTLASQLGTLKRLAPPLRNRSGVFVLGLRALEFSANPVAAYPAGLDGPRQVEEGDIIEASALTLTALNDAPPERIDALRGQLARDAFVSQSLPALPAELLPLALVALVGDSIRWVDTHLVRRASGQAHADVLGFGFAPRLLREAHLAQYSEQLAQLSARNNAARPTASQHFQALPPAGPMPREAVNTSDFTQSWFPPGVDADLALVAEDEIPALVEESLLLPPLDLTQTAEALAATSVAILVPVPRASLARQAARLQQALERATTPASSKAASTRLPIDAMRLLAVKRLPTLSPLPATTPPIDAVWAELIGAAPRLWYTRRRNLALRPQVEGTVVAVLNATDTLQRTLDLRFAGLLKTRVDTLLAAAPLSSRSELAQLLASDKLASPLLAQATLATLEAKPQVGATDVAELAETLAQPGVGEGLARLAVERPELVNDSAQLQKLASAEGLLQLDKVMANATTFEANRIATAITVPASGAVRLNNVLVVKPR